jgi:SNF2 family DNA or RNA helicase
MSDPIYTEHPLVESHLLDKQQKIRGNDTLTLRPSKFLADFIPTSHGLVPLKLRPYQIQMVFHLLMMNRFVIGDPTGTGKTLEALAAFTYIWEKETDLRLIIVTTKSSFRQWAGEIKKFCKNVDYALVEGNPQQRLEIYDAYFNSPWEEEHPRVLITTYARARLDKIELYQHLKGIKYAILLDEVSAVKSPQSQVHAAMKELGQNAWRMYGMTATMIKNRLDEGYGIFKVIYPQLFTSHAKFLQEYCVTRMQKVGRRQVPVLVGHTAEHIHKFRQQIFPFYLGRAKHDIAKDLPYLTTKEIEVEMNSEQGKLYDDALLGMLQLTDTEGNPKDVEMTKLTQLIYTQQIVNHPALLGHECARSEKHDALMELLEEELQDEKVIVFTRFKKMVNVLQASLESKGWSLGYTKAGKKCTSKTAQGPYFVRVTGDEDSEEREAAQRAFTETSGTKIIFLTMAGSESLNLQAAGTMIFYDLPWSAGDYIQLVGRMVRIGSPQTRVVAIHMLARCSQTLHKSIDHHVSKTLKKKMDLIEKTLGGQLQGDIEVSSRNQDALDIFETMLQDAKEKKK